jgi:hypothetical protein
VLYKSCILKAAKKPDFVLLPLSFFIFFYHFDTYVI